MSKLVGMSLAKSTIKMCRQRTIKKAVSFSGIGLHTGKRVLLEIKPAKVNTGIIFVRTDIKENNEVRANVWNVASTTRATSLGNNNIRITTVEHLLSALYALGITNALCHINAEELPVLDGSSIQYYQQLKKAGVKDQATAYPLLYIRDTIEVKDGDKWAKLSPADEFSVHYTIEFQHPAIGAQTFVYSDKTDFEKEIANCRTFGFLSDVERMQAMGLALGGSLDNTVVLDGDKVLNPKGLRHQNEFVRHKVLDALGDLSLSGHRIIGRVDLYKAGHELQTRLVRELLNRKSAYQVVVPELGSEEDSIFVAKSLYA